MDQEKTEKLSTKCLDGNVDGQMRKMGSITEQQDQDYLAHQQAKTSTKTDVKRPENKKTEKPKRMFMTFFNHFYDIFIPFFVYQTVLISNS